jgi:hypothetical protein
MQCKTGLVTWQLSGATTAAQKVIEMTDFRIRTEDLRPEEIVDFYVETDRDKRIVEALKSPNPIIIEGSRGTGKSFLLRVAEAQLLDDWPEQRSLPVYVSFVRSSLVHTNDPLQFLHWMLARICSRTLRALYRKGLLAQGGRSLSILAGGDVPASPEQSVMENITKQYEESYKSPGQDVDASSVPGVEDLKDAIEELCESLGMSRVVLLFDEAAHIFRPEQQRKFFTLFRDLRSPYISCNAAVYPGVTMYGPSFQPAHDATIVELNRDLLDGHYRENMREIVSKQADADLITDLTRHGENFDALAYAVAGNPRLLLKTVALAPRLSSAQVTSVLKDFYRTDVWGEHSELAERYQGHRALVDWGRTFIETRVIPDIRARNTAWEEQGRSETTCFFWIHRDAPEAVRESLRLLAYTGIVTKGDSGIVATRGELGTRYSVNLGCLVAPESSPVPTLIRIARGLTVRRFIEYGANTASFSELAGSIGQFEEPDMSDILESQLQKPVDVLDITDFQKDALRQIGCDTLGKALRSKEAHFQAVDYIGPKRSRRMMNAVVASVLEFLSG